MPRKGGDFEREVCRQLSLWWTQDMPEPRQDVFWRTAGSGARAATRGKKGRATKNSHGDVGLLDPIGQPLLDFVTIEIKRGYNSKGSIQDLLDWSGKGTKPLYLKWLEQAKQSSEGAGSKSWLVTVRRDRRESLVLFPDLLTSVLFDGEPGSYLYLAWFESVRVVGFDFFLYYAKPDKVKCSTAARSN